MNSALRIVLPGAFSLLIATPALAQMSPPNGSAQGQDWHGSQSTSSSETRYPNQGYNANRDEGYNQGNREQSYNQGYNNGNRNPPTQGYESQRYGSQGNHRYSGSQPTYSQSQQPNQNMTSAVQRRLHESGLYQGNVDGQWGPDTSTALANFQRRNDLNPTGQLNHRTVQALNLDNNGRYTDRSNDNGYRGDQQSYSSSSSTTR